MENKKAYQIQREFNIRKIVMISFIILFILAIVVIFSLYIADENFRKWADINVLRKDIASEDVPIIDLNTDKNNQIFCYNKNICILNDKILKLYDSSGREILDISVDINTALFASYDNYLALAEQNGQEFCVIADKTYLWKGKVDGEILQIAINKNGYVALVTTDTTYKSIITIYDATGKQLLRNFLSSTSVIDVTISHDNQYVAFAEIDTSGTLIQSNIKILSIEKATTQPEEAIIYSKENTSSKMVLKIQYQEKDNLVCVYDDTINVIKDAIETELVAIDDTMTFVSGNLKNDVVYIKEENTGLFNSNSVLSIINTSSNQHTTYHFNFDEIAKEMYTYGNIIGINLGTEMYFVNTNGMLIKKYTSKQEITNVILSNELAIIIYKDRIEIINL